MENLHLFIDGMADRLFEPEARRLQACVNRLDASNAEILRERVYGFQWKGTLFLASGAKTRPKRYPTLDFSLRKEGDRLLADQAMVQDDKQMVKQTMALLLKDCESVQDVRDRLPESLVELSDQLKAMPRQMAFGAYALDDRQARQVKSMLEKIDFYSATRLMY